MGDLCLRRETSRPGGLGACLRVEVCGVSGASVTIWGKRVGATLKALERSLESRGLAPRRRRAEPRLLRIATGRPVSDASQGSGLPRRARCRRLARTVLPAPSVLPVLGGVAQLGCLSRQTTPDTCLIQQGVDLLGGGEGTVAQRCPRHAAPKRADRRRTPTWCEIVSTLAAVAGVLIGLIQLLRG